MEDFSDIDIPNGWRKVFPQEIKKSGDMFYANGVWYVTNRSNEVAGYNMRFIRATSSPHIDPNTNRRRKFSSFVHKPINERVRDYLKRIKKKLPKNDKKPQNS